VIPLENLIAKGRGKSKLIAEVTNAADAKLVLEALELGTDGILLKTASQAELEKTVKVVKDQLPKMTLTTAKILSIKPIGTGARVCVDTVDLMAPGEGMLVGCQSAGFFLVEAEVNENPYVQSRPFRVNAGPASHYTLTSVANTRYLSELKAGDEVLIVGREGKVRVTNVGRSKIEFRRRRSFNRGQGRKSPRDQRGTLQNRVPTTAPHRSAGRRHQNQNHPAERGNHPSCHAQRLQTSH